MAANSQDQTANYPPPSYIDPEVLLKIDSLELRAKAVVEGFFTGLHRSPYHGFSVEFTEYRQYSTGDDLRYLDWKLYARSDRFYIKRFEDETNLRCHLIVDNSRSMSFGSLSYTKEDYSKTLAATLAYFLNTQRDAIGLLRFSEGLDEFIPARYRTGHFRKILISLEQSTSGENSGTVTVLEEAAARIRKRGLIVIVSDLLVELDSLEAKLGYLRANGNEVVIFHVLDPAEKTFDFDEATLFLDAESGQEVYVDPHLAKKQYQSRLNDHLDNLNHICQSTGVQLVSLTTDAPLELALSDFLRVREQTKVTLRK